MNIIRWIDEKFCELTIRRVGQPLSIDGERAVTRIYIGNKPSYEICCHDFREELHQ